MLTGLGQPGHLLRALKAHVRGFVVKDARATTLTDGIRRVVAGERVLDPELIAAAPGTGESPLTHGRPSARNRLDALRIARNAGWLCRHAQVGCG